VKRQGVGMVGFWGSVGMGILWGYPQDFLWVWDGCGDRNSVPTAALLSTLYTKSHQHWIKLYLTYQAVQNAVLRNIALMPVLKPTKELWLWTTRHSYLISLIYPPVMFGWCK